MTDNYIKTMLGENERVLLVTRQHWFVLFSSILLEIIVTLGVIIAISIAALNFLPAAIAYLLVLIPLLSMLHDILVWRNRQYMVTNRRVIQFSGIFNKNVVDSSLEKVNDVKMTQSFFGRIFDYADVEIMTASEMGVNVFRRIGDPVKFKTAMLNAKEKLGYQDMNMRGRSFENIPALIAELDELRKKGVVSEEEFQEKKKQLLAKIN
jgi:uncharacterized membrane protein YdbT with pleckstrin-like domain